VSIFAIVFNRALVWISSGSSLGSFLIMPYSCFVAFLILSLIIAFALSQHSFRIPTTIKEGGVLNQMLTHCANLAMVRVLAFGVILGVAIELCTVWTRFGLGFQS